MKWRYLLLALLLSALLITAMGCESDYKAIELVPASSNFIAGIQIGKILGDQDIRDAYDKMEKEADQPQTFNEALEELFNESGVDINDFSYALVFGDISNIEESEYVAFIAEGTFDETEFIKNVEENSGEEFTTSDYKGHKVYSSEAGDFLLAFLSDSLLLGGGTQAVKDSLDVSNGDSQPVAFQLLDTYNRYDDALISLAMIVPEDAGDILAGEPIMDDMPVSMDVFSGIDIVGFSLNKKDSTLDSRIECHFLEADSAQDASDTLGGLLSMFKGMTDDPDLKELLGNIEVSASGSWMTLAFNIEISQIEELIETYAE